MHVRVASPPDAAARELRADFGDQVVGGGEHGWTRSTSSRGSNAWSAWLPG